MKILIPFILIYLTSYGFREPVDVVIIENKFIVNNKPIIIKFNPPLVRTRNDGSILISINLTSSSKLSITKIVWHNFNPL